MEKEKPEWLQALEAQSWQAELIASGLAIYGSISMGVYLDYFSDWAVLRFEERTLNILTFMFLYIFSAHALLVISFITHLILRILWAGILGLSSVFPKGVNTETKVYPDYFKEKLKRDYPDLSKYSLELDKMCSLIFSVLCAMVIVLINISLWIGIYLLVSFLLLKFLPVSIVNFIGYFFVGIYFLIAIIGAIMTQGKFKNSKVSKKYGYQIIMNTSKFVYLIGNRSFNYITQTIRSNTTSKSFFIGMFAILILSMFFAFPRFINTVEIYKPELFAGISSHESYAVKENYKDQLDKKLILQPYIQSELIEDDFLQLYIPLFEREKPIIEAICDIYVWNDAISKNENRRLRVRSRNRCAPKYYNLMIDEQNLKNLSYHYKSKFQNNRGGYEVFIPIDSLDMGHHVLKIKNKYKGGDQDYIRSIPFYKTK
jgi:hypothetical protein